MFGIVEPLGEYDDGLVYEAISRCIGQEYGDKVMERIRLGKNIRIYISGEDLGKILAALGRGDWKPVSGEYDYVLVLEHLD